MDGIHDLGGKQGFGRVEREENEPVFHDRWEASMYTISMALRRAAKVQNTDQFRHAIERIDPVAYLTHGYYGRWLGGMEALLVEGGEISTEELTERALSLGADPAALIAARPDPTFGTIAPESSPDAQRTLPDPGRFTVGQSVTTHGTPSGGHTRLPAYARGHRGTIVAMHGGWLLPDANAHGLGERPEHLYTVEFSGEELWGSAAEAGLKICVDLFESYLEAANE
ncbi:MAG: nitrile hydratase subunit beta [Gammaproteobacteria bacterium]|nr:nitrile hydratase subunit beta [Gammaproteobacteria bacterium]